MEKLGGNAESGRRSDGMLSSEALNEAWEPQSMVIPLGNGPALTRAMLPLFERAMADGRPNQATPAAERADRSKTTR